MEKTQGLIAGQLVNWVYFFHGECKVCDLCWTEWLRDEVGTVLSSPEWQNPGRAEVISYLNMTVDIFL